ncbi:MAG TPA: hypothetical protein VMV12_03550 [Candidatus Micrarchaeaceae archaeon]|nr:hypothetical protein [Candidatus Micrarchaeaceae archaeon]
MSMELQAPPEPQISPPDSRPTEVQPAVSPRAAETPRRTAKASGRRSYRVGELVILSVAIVDAFLALDFLFRATAATNDGFVSVVDRVGSALAHPFAGIFGPGVPQVGHTTFWAALLALAVYTLAALVLVRLMQLLSGPFRGRRGSA